jgi:anaerobic ribonucleoside-triphosphate reductase activating protein
MHLSEQFEFDPWLRSLNLYVTGCRRRCPGCHNPELQTFSCGVPWEDIYPSIARELSGLRGIITRVFLWGGEPLDQPLDELKSLLSRIKDSGLQVWLFTGNELSQVPPSVLSSAYLDYIKTGAYRQEFRSDSYFRGGLRLATTNQRLFRLVADHKVEEILS